MIRCLVVLLLTGCTHIQMVPVIDAQTLQVTGETTYVEDGNTDLSLQVTKVGNYRFKAGIRQKF